MFPFHSFKNINCSLNSFGVEQKEGVIISYAQISEVEGSTVFVQKLGQMNGHFCIKFGGMDRPINIVNRRGVTFAPNFEGGGSCFCQRGGYFCVPRNPESSTPKLYLMNDSS